MGRPIRYEPSNIDALSANREVYDIFLEAGWIGYFQLLNEFHEETTLQFSLELIREIRGLRIDASKKAVANVTGLPWTGECWFFKKRHNLRVAEEFLAPGEQVHRRDRGVALETLPIPWDQVTTFLKRYITCEGRYKVVYIYDFILLSHLFHHRLINMTFYLSQTIQNMVYYDNISRHPLSSLTNHGLIKLLVQRCLTQNNLTWE